MKDRIFKVVEKSPAVSGINPTYGPYYNVSVTLEEYRNEPGACIRMRANVHNTLSKQFDEHVNEGDNIRVDLFISLREGYSNNGSKWYKNEVVICNFEKVKI